MNKRINNSNLFIMEDYDVEADSHYFYNDYFIRGL
jgi:hypothetical protein